MNCVTGRIIRLRIHHKRKWNDANFSVLPISKLSQLTLHQSILDPAPALSAEGPFIIGLKGGLPDIGCRGQADANLHLGQDLPKRTQENLGLSDHAINLSVHDRKVIGVEMTTIINPQEENRQIGLETSAAFVQVPANVQDGLPGGLIREKKRAAPQFISGRLIGKKTGIETRPGPAPIAFVRNPRLGLLRIVQAQHLPGWIARLTQKAGQFIRVKSHVGQTVADQKQSQFTIRSRLG